MSRSDAMTGSKQLASVAGPGAPGLGRRRRWPRSQIDEISLLVVTLATRAKRKLTCISRMAVNSASLQKLSSLQSVYKEAKRHWQQTPYQPSRLNIGGAHSISFLVAPGAQQLNVNTGLSAQRPVMSMVEL
jgi:hypothetical protein